MGRKENNKKVKRDQEQSEEEVSQEEIEEDQEGDDQDIEFDEEFEDDIDGDEILLKKIEDRIMEADDEEKLSWAAIYEVKKQQAEMNEEMQKEIDVIKNKYEIKKMPLLHKISEAVSGKKLDKSVYANNEFVKSVNLNKTKPKALNDYWSKVFDSCGLISHEDDIELLEKLTSFKCQLIDAEKHDLKLTFEFADNEYFGNKIEISVSGSVADGNFTKKLEYTVKSKPVDESSLFGQLTNKDSDDQQVSDTCFDLYRSYVSSTYFYFHEPADDFPEDDEEYDGEEDEDEDDDEENGKDVRAVNKPKGSAITQKPECKQQ